MTRIAAHLNADNMNRLGIANTMRMAKTKGTVLFLDSSWCFHYGSRNCTTLVTK